MMNDGKVGICFISVKNKSDFDSMKVSERKFCLSFKKS